MSDDDESFSSASSSSSNTSGGGARRSRHPKKITKSQRKSKEMLGLFGSDSEEEDKDREDSNEKDTRRSFFPRDDDGDEAEDDQGLAPKSNRDTSTKFDPSSFFKPATTTTTTKPTTTTTTTTTKGGRKRRLSPGPAEIGQFEAHTKGFGSKMLKAMGWVEGKGLGVGGNGLVAPVKVQVRPEKAGIGTIKEKINPEFTSIRGRKNKDNDDEANAKAEVSEEENEEDEYAEEVKRAREALTGGRGGKKKKRGVYDVLTADELARRHQTTQGQKFIDFRGGDGPVELSGGLFAEQDAAVADARHSACPELVANVRQVVSMSEMAVVEADRRQRLARESAERNASRAEGAAKRSQAAKREAAELAHLLERVEALSLPTEDDAQHEVLEAGVASLCSGFSRLRVENVGLYTRMDLDAAHAALVFPMLRRLMARWQPEESPAHGVAAFAAYRELFRASSGKVKERDRPDFFLKAVIDLALPAIRSYVSGRWRPAEDPEGFVAVCEAWWPVLPSVVRANIVDQLLLPKLSALVERWGGGYGGGYSAAAIPAPHLWIHPWLPLLHRQLKPIVSTVCEKMGPRLARWEVDGDGAVVDPLIAELSHWSRVFQPTEASALYGKSLLPRLGRALADPNQDLELAFTRTAQWCSTLPAADLAATLEAAFFPRWFDLLSEWLATHPDPAEVATWFEGWTSLFPEALTALPVVRALLDAALDMLDQFLADRPVTKPDVHALTEGLLHTSISSTTTTTTSTKAGKAKALRDGATFKDVVQAFAESQGVDFAPLDRSQDGKQVYSFSGIPIYLDKDVVFISVGAEWRPVSLQDLVSLK